MKSKAIKLFLLSILFILLLPQADRLGGVWQTSVYPAHGVKVKLANGAEINGDLSLLLNGQQRIVMSSGAHIDFDPSTVMMMEIPFNKLADPGLHWRSLLPVGVLILFLSIGLSTLFLMGYISNAIENELNIT